MKLRTRIYLIFLTIALIPLIIITILAYTRYTTTTYERMDEISTTMFHNAVSELDDTLEGIERSAGMFTFFSDNMDSYSITKILKQFSASNSHPDNYTVLSANNDIRFICQNIFYSYDYIYGIYVFTPSGAILSHTNGQNGDLLYRYEPYQDSWYQDTVALHGKLYISPIQDHPMISGHKNSLFFAQAIYDVYNHEFLGVLMLDCSPTLFDISNVNTLTDIAHFELLDTNNNSILYESPKTEAFSLNDESVMTMQTTLSMENLKLTASFDYNALFKEFNYTGILLITMAIICGLAIVFISYYLSKYITYPIEHLGRKMSKQHSEHLTISGKYLNRTDEIGTLYNEYNTMVEELNASIKKDYKDKLISLDAQMRSLEAQINSHFLFNTLESINSLAEIDEDDRISTMVLALGNMFRYSIKTQSELVTIQDEINHVTDYVSIQQIRFDNKFKLQVDLPEDMLSLKVLKLILQPLVENALYHGLNYCSTGDTIVVRGSLEQNYLLLSVSDNGIGMSPTELQALQNKLEEASSFTELGHRTNQSIGLKNIQTRIELYYGKGYGLTIYSTEHCGSTILIRLPRLI